MKIRTDQSLMADHQQVTKNISSTWNKISAGWKRVWGEHIHHGYYENKITDTRVAQEKLIEKLSDYLTIKIGDHILDVGCGMGGSSIYLAKKYQAQVTGITLSSKQVQIATAEAQQKMLKNIIFEVKDAHHINQYGNEMFDLVWSLESCEQFYNKELFLQQAHYVLKKQGQLMLATWCSDKNEYENKEARAYRKLCYAFDLPYMPTNIYYRNCLLKQGFSISHEFDWTHHVKKSWEIGLSLVQRHHFLQILWVSGWRGFRFAKQIQLLKTAFQKNKIRYCVFIAKK